MAGDGLCDKGPARGSPAERTGMQGALDSCRACSMAGECGDKNTGHEPYLERNLAPGINSGQ